MLQTVVTVLAVVVVGGTSAADLEWWKIGPIYQIYPATYYDSDGDGWGDLKGIIDKVDYVRDLGVGAIWLSPIYPSPMRDNGYDASSYVNVNPKFGTLTDAENLIKTYHDKGMKVVLDFVPNHTSNESEWFQDSVKKAGGKSDWYVWRDPKGTDGEGNPIPPNNWRSTFGGPAWTYVKARNQFYYHMFGVYQPDLNYNNTDVLNAMKDSLRFWLKKGVDGFRMDAVPYLVETNYEQNEPTICADDSKQVYSCLEHIYTMNQAGTHKVLEAFDEVLRDPDFVKNGTRAMWVEAYNNITELMKYYEKVTSPFNFQYISYLFKNSNASVIQKLTTDYMNALNGKWPNWVVGNHDNSRVGTRMGTDMIDSMTILTQLLPGTSITYYGEELGMTDAVIETNQRRDWAGTPSRDPERTPMQWNSSSNAGFSSSKDLYLPVNSNFYSVNVATESKAPSHLDIYKKAVKLHKKHIGTVNDTFATATYGSWVFAIQRPGLLIVTNLDNEETTMSIDQLKLSSAPKSLTVELASINANITEGTSIKSSANITLTPRSSIVFSTNSAASSFGLSYILVPIVCCFRYLWSR